MADHYDDYTREELIRLLRERDRKPKFGLVWERDEIEHEKAINDDFVALDFDAGLSCGVAPFGNLIIEGDNFDALRFLRMTHAGKVKCIYIDPPYNLAFAHIFRPQMESYPHLSPKNGRKLEHFPHFDAHDLVWIRRFGKISRPVGPDAFQVTGFRPLVGDNFINRVQI